MLNLNKLPLPLPPIKMKLRYKKRKNNLKPGESFSFLLFSCLFVVYFMMFLLIFVLQSGQLMHIERFNLTNFCYEYVLLKT